MTSEGNGDGTGGPADRRVEVDLEFATLREFREQMAPRINRTGMFIKTDQPYARGTALLFRFVMPEGFVLAQGTGVVTEVRTAETHPDQDPGVVVWFDELEPQTRDIINELVEFHSAVGGEPFDIGLGGGEIGEIPTDALAGSAPPPAERRTEGVLPEWLSEVAEKHDVDLMLERAPAAAPQEPPGTGAPASIEQDLEFSMILDDAGPDATPIMPADERASEPTIAPRAAGKQPKDLRLWPLAAAAAVVAIVLVGWWFVLRPAPVETPAAVSTSEEPVVAPTPEPTSGSGKPQPIPGAKPTEVPEAAPDEPVVAPPTTRPANRIVSISAARIGDATVVDIRGNGALATDRVKFSLLDDPPRVWLRVRGIETFYRPNDIPVSSPEVARIRVGHHPEDTPVSLWVVLDLADPSVVVRETSSSGDTFRISVARP